MEDKARTLGEATLRLAQAQADLNTIEYDLRSIGDSWEKTGRSLKTYDGDGPDRETVEMEVSRLWTLLDKHDALRAERDTAKNDVNLLTP